MTRKEIKEGRMRMKNKKIDWQLVGTIAFIVVTILILVIVVVLKVWVFCEYADTPISEVPSWVIPWLE